METYLGQVKSGYFSYYDGSKELVGKVLHSGVGSVSIQMLGESPDRWAVNTVVTEISPEEYESTVASAPAKITRLVCDVCESEFNHEITRGRLPYRCPECRTIQKPNKPYVKVSNEIECLNCHTKFIYTKRGRKPLNCPDCAPVKVISNNENKPNTITCSMCNATFTHSKRGRRPSKCAMCSSRMKEQNKPAAALTCNRCGITFNHRKRGRRPLYCPPCKSILNLSKPTTKSVSTNKYSKSTMVIGG